MFLLLTSPFPLYEGGVVVNYYAKHTYYLMPSLPSYMKTIHKLTPLWWGWEELICMFYILNIDSSHPHPT